MRSATACWSCSRTEAALYIAEPALLLPGSPRGAAFDIGPAMAKSYDAFYVGGEWVRPSSGDTIQVVNPATEEPCATVPAAEMTMSMPMSGCPFRIAAIIR